MYWTISIILWLILCIICGAVANSIGRKFGNYFLLSFLLSPLLGFLILLIKGRPTEKERMEDFLITPHIFYCAKCKQVYGGTHTEESFVCPECKGTNMETSISRDEWRSYSDSQKEKIKTAFDCGQYELKLDAAPSVTITAPAASSTNADEILKYKKLLDCGAITQEEYDAKKKQLLDM